MLTLYTIGHSNRRLNEFCGILESAQIQTLVDVRETPASSRFPHFDGEALRQALAGRRIVYHWAGRQLGGRRKPMPGSVHTALADNWLRAYADHMDSATFQKGAAQLIQLARTSRTCILCAERRPQDCHRQLIADYLILQNIQVIHLLDNDETKEHHLHPCARRESASLIYDRHSQNELLLNE